MTLHPPQLEILDALAAVSGYLGRDARERCLREIVLAALEDAADEPTVRARVLSLRAAQRRHPSARLRVIE
jgi:hypothetical protein